MNEEPHLFESKRMLHRIGLSEYLVWQLCCMLAIFSSCSNETGKRETLYPIDSLVRSQVNYLSKGKASVRKIVVLGDQKVKATFTPADTTEWVKELDIFSNLQLINKPVNRDLYTVEDGRQDSKSNLRIKEFKSTPKEGQKGAPVEYLRIYYQNNLKNIRKIESKYNETNSMYAGTRYLVMEFEDIHHQPVLTHYSVYGGQKMILADTVTYTINASVSFGVN